jgi:hypothetical protein
MVLPDKIGWPVVESWTVIVMWASAGPPHAVWDPLALASALL